MRASSGRERNRAPGSTPAVVAASADIALAVGLGFFRTMNSQIGERRAEGPLPTVALVIVLAAPGIVALLGVAIDRPVLFGVAGIACFPLAFVSVLAVPIWLPAILLTIAFVQASNSRPPAPLFGMAIVFGFTWLLFFALRILITGNGQYTYTYPGGSQGGDYFLPSHATWCIVVVGGDLVLATMLARFSRSPSRAAR